MNKPATPLDAYKTIIDQLVDDTRRSLSSRLITEERIYSRAPLEDERSQFVRSLSSQQRKVLAGMVQEERDGTIHDVLALLTWWIRVQDVGLTFCGEKM